MVLHLRSDRRPVHEVPSLMLWRQLEATLAPPPRRLALPRLPLLLLLQVLALVLLVLALTHPAGVAVAPAPGRVVVVDDSAQMSVGGRLAAARARVAQLARPLPSSMPVSIIVSGGQPSVWFRGTAATVPGALRRLRATSAPDRLGLAVALAAGLLKGPQDRVIVLRAPEDALPPLRGARATVTTIVVGRRIVGQGFAGASARCGLGAGGLCAVVAWVRSTAPVARTDPYTAYVGGRRVLQGRVSVPAGSRAAIVLTALPGEQVRLRLGVSDPLPDAAQAFVTVPGLDGAPSPTVVTLVGTPGDALPVARALAAVPGVVLRLRTPRSYRPADARGSDLLVLDGWLPPGRLPPAPSLLLIDPPRLPGGRVGRVLSLPVVSGSDQSSSLLDGVDLTGWAIATGAAHQLRLPLAEESVVWSPQGPLLAAGDNGRQRVAVMAFDPSQSELPQLNAFPILLANVVRWAWGWAPAAVVSGTAITVDATPGARSLRLQLGARLLERLRLRGAPATLTLPRPGLYTVIESGPGVLRPRSIAANLAPPVVPSTPVDLALTGRSVAAAPGPSLVPPVLAAALLMLLLELLVWTRSRRSWAPP